MSKKLMRKKLALMLANLKKKRRYYTELEYLESTGTQYIDTGLLPVNDMEFECKFTFTSLVSTNLTIIGSRDGEKRCQPIGAYNNKWSASIGGSYDANGTSVSANTPYIIKSTITNGQTITTNVNGSQASICTSTTGLPSQELYIFARNFYGNTDPADSKVNGKLNFLKIKANGVLVRDFIPVLDWNMTPCMYDRVTEQLFYNQGTGDFIAGREIHPVEYLESTGTQYINTGYIPTNDTGIQIKHTICADNGTDNIIFGCRQDSADTRFWEDLDWGNDDSIGWGYGVYSNQDPTYSIYRYKLISSDIGKTVVSRLNYLNSRNCSIDDNIRNLPQTTLPTITRPIYIFAGNNQGNAVYFTNFKVYEVQISEGSALVRDFIPAIDSSGTPFMFDRVSHTCYLNQGTGQFSYPAKEVDYLQSSGTQYIDLGITSKSSMRAKSKFNLANVSAQAIFGSSNAISNGVGVFLGTASTGAVYCNNTSNPISPPLTLVANTDYEFDVSLTAVSINGVNYTASTTSDNNYNMLLFARMLAGSVERNISGKIYYFKLYDNGVLVRDFIPCFKDGQAGMLDKANNVFYPNAGTGTFTTGKIVESEYE